MLKRPIPISFGLNSQQSVQSVCAVIHIDDNNTETLDLSLMQGGEHIAVSPNSTVTARFVRVKDKILISDNVPCAVQENGNILIPIDNAAAHMLVGEIKIEVNIVDENDILTMQFPLVIRVNNTILVDAEISPESEGTIPELLEEAREAAESATQAAVAAAKAISTKQDKLTAGQNITITEENVISASSGSNDYTELENKPSINNVTLSGNKTSDDLNLQGKLTAGNSITIENDVISAEGGVTDYNDLTDKPVIKIGNSDWSLQTIGQLANQLIFNNGIVASEWTGTGGGIQIGIDGTPFNVNGFSGTAYDFNLTWTYLGEYTKYGFFAIPLDWYGRFINKPDLFSSHTIVSICHTPMMVNYRGGNYQECLRYVVTLDNYSNIHIFYQPTNNDLEWGDWVELTGGGAQIVSAVVNADGTITFTDSEGNSFTTSGESVIGASPSATVQQTASGATVSITDKNGTTTANISNGDDYILTDADKQEIAQMAVNLLPNADTMSY